MAPISSRTNKAAKSKIETVRGAPIPWEDRPAGCSDVVWRSSRNPIIRRHHIPCSNSIFNSAVVRFGDGFAGVFRCDDKKRDMGIHSGLSKDGINWNIELTGSSSNAMMRI